MWRVYRARNLAKNPDYYRETQRRYRVELRANVVAAYGSRCACCDERSIEFLTVDHVKGGGNAHQKTLSNTARKHPGGSEFYRWLARNGFPQDEFRLLCMNCNFALGKYGFCPHQRALKEPRLSICPT